MHVLLVDDDDQFLQLIATLLVRAGNTVHTSGKVPDALHYLSENPADVIITDILMPGQDGLELIMKVCREYPHIAVIAVSGEGLHTDLYLGLATKLGAAATLRKPFSVDELLVILARLALGRGGDGAPERRPPKPTS
jgi:DNA-binding NtrC family response regulator